MIAWAMHGFKVNSILPTSLLAYPTPRSGALLKNLNKMNTIGQPQISYPKVIPVLRQTATFTSNSNAGWQYQFNPKGNHGPKLRQSVLMASVPFIESESIFTSTMPELDKKKNNIMENSPFEIIIGAAWAPKRPRSKLPAWCLADCGEDAFFTTTVNGQYCLGVADGVGGWSEVGVDPSQFAWELMNNCRNQCEAQTLVNKIQPLQVLEMAYSKLIKEKKVRAGSSTACLAVIDTETGILRSVNLGDSGYIIIRNGITYYRARETTHYFNAPYQLSILPPEMDTRNHIRNTPSEGLIETLKLEHGDIVVMGTDGLFDNLFHTDIETEIQTNKPSNFDILLSSPSKHSAELKAYSNKVAGALVRKARLRAKDATKDSPFSTEARKHGRFFRGGKMDDITVVVTLITEKKLPKVHI